MSTKGTGVEGTWLASMQAGVLAFCKCMRIRLPMHACQAEQTASDTPRSSQVHTQLGKMAGAMISSQVSLDQSRSV